MIEWNTQFGNLTIIATHISLLVCCRYYKCSSANVFILLRLIASSWHSLNTHALLYMCEISHAVDRECAPHPRQHMFDEIYCCLSNQAHHVLVVELIPSDGSSFMAARKSGARKRAYAVCNTVIV